MNRSTPGLPVHHQLLEFTQTHVHWLEAEWNKGSKFIKRLPGVGVRVWICWERHMGWGQSRVLWYQSQSYAGRILTQRHAHAHVRFPDSVQWEELGNNESHILDSKFRRPLKIIGYSWRNCNSIARVTNMQDEPWISSTKSINCSKNDGEISKGQRSELKEVPTVQGWKKCEHQNKW